MAEAEYEPREGSAGVAAVAGTESDAFHPRRSDTTHTGLDGVLVWGFAINSPQAPCMHYPGTNQDTHPKHENGSTLIHTISDM